MQSLRTKHIYILEKSNNEVKNMETSSYIFYVKEIQIGNKVL